MIKYRSIYKGEQVEIHTSTHRNLLDRSMTAPPPVLSPSSILLPPSSHSAFISAVRHSVVVRKSYFIFPFVKNVSRKFRNLQFPKSWSVAVAAINSSRFCYRVDESSCALPLRRNVQPSPSIIHSPKIT